MLCLPFEGVGNATACVVQDRIYVTGGHYGYRGSCTYEKIQTYRADINEWSITTISPHPGTFLEFHSLQCFECCSKSVHIFRFYFFFILFLKFLCICFPYIFDIYLFLFIYVDFFSFLFFFKVRKPFEGPL